MNIQIGQSYKWHQAHRNVFRIIDLYTDGNGIDRIMWEVTEGNEEEVGEVIRGYWLLTLKDALREGDAYLIDDPDKMVYPKRINKMKFI